MANEKRLIDAWKLVIDLAKIKKCGEYDHEDVMAVIASQKTVDAVEVVHGRWDKVKQDLGDGITTYRLGCSECGYLKNTLTGNYCPNCGAKMDGDGNG